MTERYRLFLYAYDDVYRERLRMAGDVSADDYQDILRQVAAAIDKRIDEREQANDTD